MSRLAALAALAAAAWLAVAIDMAPLGGALSGWPGPDLLFCVVALWALRRPAQTPAAVVFLLGLTRDLLSGGPVGPGALALTLAAEALRARAPALRRGGFAGEWLAVAATAAVATGGQWMALVGTLSPTPPVADLAGRLAATAAAWPIVALALRWAVRIGPAQSVAEGAQPFAARRRATERAFS